LAPKGWEMVWADPIFVINSPLDECVLQKKLPSQQLETSS